MIIHQLKMVNFKSYLGEHVLGPFNSRFNCVIGPNGNGKSNIIDAVLFVFGFKSTKLRQDSLPSLIHKSAFAQPERASVSVVFNDGGAFIEVSRSVTRNGTISYKLNQERISWNDLRSILVSKKIDLNKNLFIILQGQVQRLCQLSPETMVEYLEYVSGSDEFKEPIAQAEKQYIEGSVKREEIKMGTNIKKKLFDNIDDKARNKTVMLLLKLRVDVLEHLILKKEVMANLDKVVKMKEAEKQLKNAIEEVQDQIRAIEEELNQKNIQLFPINQKIEQNEGRINSLTKQLQRISLKLKQIQREIFFLANDKEKKNQERKRYTKQKDQLATIFEQQQEVLESYSQLKRNLQSQQQLPRLKVCLQLEDKKHALQEQLQLISAKTKEDEMNLAVNRQKMALFQQKQKEFKTLKQKYSNQLKQIAKQKKDIAPKLRQAEQTINHLEIHKKNSNNEKGTMSHQEKVISEIRNANKLKIICPELTLHTLRQLVVINPTYRQVIDTILPQLDYFIVETCAQARVIADYLRAKKIGRMTFLIKELINQSSRDISLVGSAPSQTKLIIDLIKSSDSKIRNILIWALGNTLVASDLEIAMKVAYYDDRKFRVITTKGEFIDSSGTITKLSLKSSGGEDQQLAAKKLETLKRLKQSLQTKVVELDRNQQDINNVLQSILAQETTFDGLDEVILAELQKQIAKNNQKMAKDRDCLRRISEQISMIKLELENNQFNMKHYSSLLQQLRQLQNSQDKVKKIQNCQSILMNLETKLQKVGTEAERLSSQMQDKMKTKISLETEQAKIKGQIEVNRDQIEATNVGKDAIMKEVTALQQSRLERLNRLSGNKVNSGNDRLKQELHRVRIAIKNAQYEKLSLLNKLEASMKAIKDFSLGLFKNIYEKYSEIFPTSQSHIINEGDRIDRLFASQPPLQIKVNHQLQMLDVFSKVQIQFLMNSSHRKTSMYRDQEDILPEPTIADLLFESTTEKELKLSFAYQQQKLKQQSKEEISPFDYSIINYDLFDEYKEHRDQYKLCMANLKEVESHLNTIKDKLIALRKQRLDVFMDHFNGISVELNRIYTKLTGGKAELNFVDSMNPFEGVEFSVRPVNKSWKRVNLLSGGQKTFTSLALIFACQQIKKFPFYFMDEIDAALDYKNTTLLATFIKEKTSTQHIVISLRKNMYQECNRIIGIYKVKDQTHTIEYDMNELRNDRE